MGLASVIWLIVCLFGCLFPVGLASSAISNTAPFRVGETIAISQQLPSKITECSWTVTNNRNEMLIPDVRSTRRTCVRGICVCSVEVEATEDLNGSLWVYKGVTESGIAEQDGTMITIISVPSVSLRFRTTHTTITAGEEKQFFCDVSDARPVPNVVWTIGDIKVDSKNYSVDSQVGQNTKAITHSVLKRRFVPEDNKKVLRCFAEADWLRKEDKTTDQTTLDIQFPPVPQNTITRYVFEENKSGEVQVTVHANPRPHRALWILPTPSNDKLEVGGNPVVDDSAASNYVGRPCEDNGNDTFTYRLLITSVQQRDANPGIDFQVFNMVGTRETQCSIPVDIHLRPEPVPERHMASSGSTACCVVTKLWQIIFPLFVLAAAILKVF